MAHRWARRLRWWWLWAALLGLISMHLEHPHGRGLLENTAGGAEQGQEGDDEPGLERLFADTYNTLIILAESNPGAPFKGLDVARLVVYGDGTIVDHRHTDDERALRGRVPRSTARALARELATPAFLDLPRTIGMTNAPGYPTVTIAVQVGGLWKRVSASKSDLAGFATPGPDLQVFSEAYQTLLSVQVSDEAPVVPYEMEVTFWDGSGMTDSIPWPDDIRKPSGTLGAFGQQPGVLQYYLADSGIEPRLMSFAERAAGKSVLVNDQRWAMYVRRFLNADYAVRKVLSIRGEPIPPDPCTHLAMANASSTGSNELPVGRLVRAPGLDGLRRRPLIYMIERDPRRLIIGSDEPTLVVYEDGLAIQNRVIRGRPEQRQGRLSTEQVTALVQQIAANGFMDLPRRMTAESHMHAQAAMIGVRVGEWWKWVTVEGLHLDALPRDAPRLDVFASTYCTLWSLDVPDARVWEPEEVDVMLWGYNHAKQAVPWPSDVPPPPSTLKPPKLGEGAYKHRIEGKYEPVLIELLEDAPGQAVLFNGEKWAVDLRRRVPEEDYIGAAARGEPQPADER